MLLNSRKIGNLSWEPTWHCTCCLLGAQLKVCFQQLKDGVLSRDTWFGRKGPEHGVRGLGFKFCFYHSLTDDPGLVTLLNFPSDNSETNGIYPWGNSGSVSIWLQNTMKMVALCPERQLSECGDRFSLRPFTPSERLSLPGRTGSYVDKCPSSEWPPGWPGPRCRPSGRVWEGSGWPAHF